MTVPGLRALVPLPLLLGGGESLLHNGEARNANGWTPNGPAELFEHDRSVGCAAQGALRIRRPPGADSTPYNWFQRAELPRKTPRRLELCVQLLTSGFAPGSEACAMVQVCPESGPPLSYAWANQVRTDGGWTETRAVFDVPEGARHVNVLAYLTGTGTVWFDDFVLEETEKPLTASPVNAGDPATEALARRAASQIPWLFSGEAARARARKEAKPVLVYVRCTDDAEGLESARRSIEAVDLPLAEDGYAKDLLFRAAVLAAPEIADLVARRTVPLCVTYELASARGDPDLPAGWNHTPGAAGVAFRVDGAVGAAQPGSLRIDGAASGEPTPHNWRQVAQAPAELPARCRLSARIRAEGLVQGSEACVIVNCFDARGQMLSHTRLPEVRADTDWRAADTSFQVPEGCQSLLVMAYLVGAGTAWFDDLSIELRGARVRSPELLRNGGLDERGAGLEGFALDPAQVTTPALVLADAEGRVLRKLHRIGTLSEDQVDHWLRSALAEAGPPSRARKAADLYRDGELERVLALTEGRSDTESRLLWARAQVRLGALERAEATLGESTSGAARAVRAWIALRRGEWEAARTLLDQATPDLEGEDRLAARYWSAWCSALLGNHAEALARWRELVDSASGAAAESPTRFRAAACLLDAGPRPFLAATTRAWPRTPDLGEETEGPYGASYDRARSTVALLELQRDDGSFGSHQGIEGLGYVDPAVTAIALRALARVEPGLPSGLAERSRAARARALAYLEDYAAREQPSFRALDPFNLAYVVLALLELDAKGPCAALLARMQALQLADGNWTVYHAERPASFNTALCLLALRRAEEAGLEVPAGARDRALAALEAMRQAGGLFPYSTAPGHEWMTTPHGSIARDPLCEEALLACGRGSRELLAAALERFLAHHAELRAPTKRLYDYFNQRGHGGYYFFFAHDNALRAARAYAPPELVREVEARTRAAVLAAMEGDGTWMDKFLLGRAYGTAMALLILE
ncbi:MAG TPA: hypothetical protein VF530_16395 [Planctomycetota bacterium]